MSKPLNEMTNEERWRLLLIVLNEHNPIWKENYLTEKIVIEQAIEIQNIIRMNHFGITAVPN